MTSDEWLKQVTTLLKEHKLLKTEMYDENEMLVPACDGVGIFHFGPPDALQHMQICYTVGLKLVQAAIENNISLEALLNAKPRLVDNEDLPILSPAVIVQKH